MPHTAEALAAIQTFLERAEVTRDQLQLPDAQTLVSVDQLRAFVTERLASQWLTIPEDVEGRAADLAWAPVVLEAGWSGPIERSSDPLGPWLRGSFAAYLTNDEMPDVFVPAPNLVSARTLDTFRYQQVGAVLGRLYGDVTLVRLLCDAVTLAEAFGADVADALSQSLTEQALEPGRGADDPTRVTNAVVDAYLASGRELDPSRTYEKVMLTQVIEYVCLNETDRGLERSLPYSSCMFDFEARRVTAVTHEVTEPRVAALPPFLCQSQVDAGHPMWHASVAAPSRRAAYSLAQQIVVNGAPR